MQFILFPAARRGQHCFLPSLVCLLLACAAALLPVNARAEEPTALATINAQSIMELRELPAGENVLAVEDLPAVRQALWEKYRDVVLADEARKTEYESGQIVRGGRTMRFGLYEIGERPEEGYPLYICLHGGGRAPAELNDRAWQHMQIYYRRSVENGVYIAPRGIEDQSNLHSRYDSFPMYDRMIENAIVYNGVNPNRVYLLGFSAGGDGVYQVSTRMPDRFAAVNMSAGHPNDAKPTNLMNLPMLLQVGENDTAYSRNTRTPEYFLQLLAEREKFGTGYETEVFVHQDKPHNFHDEDPEHAEYAVMADAQKWLEEGDRTPRMVDPNAVTWVTPYTRNPTPDRVVWQLYNRAERFRIESPGLPGPDVDENNLLYWLDVSQADVAGIELVDVELDRDTNTITVRQPAPGLRLLLREEMVDFAKPVTIEVDGQTLTAEVRPNLETLARTLTERGDPNYAFAGELTLVRDDAGQWSLETP